MKKAPNKSIATHSPSLQEEGQVHGGGWRIKERRTNHRAGSARPDAGLLRSRQGNASEQIACASEDDNSPQRRRWCHPYVILASMSTAVVTLMMVADVQPPWLELSSASQPANAETHTSSTSTQGQKTTAQLVMPDDGYQLYLGAYRSELGARLMWAGLEADSDTLLDGLDPSFKHQEGEGGTLYHVLVGTYARHDTADSHCAWLNEREVACSIVGSD